MLKGKKCPRPGIVVQTKGGLIGVTTGECGPRVRPEVALTGNLGVTTFKRSELTKLTKRQEAKLKEELQRAKGRAAPRRSNYEATPRAVRARSNYDATPPYGSNPGESDYVAIDGGSSPSIHQRRRSYPFNGLGEVAGKGRRKKVRPLTKAQKAAEKARLKHAAKLRALDPKGLDPLVAQLLAEQQRDDTRQLDTLLAREIKKLNPRAAESLPVDWEPYIPQHEQGFWPEYTPITSRSETPSRRFVDEQYYENWTPRSSVTSERVYGPHPELVRSGVPLRAGASAKPNVFLSRRKAGKFSGYR